MVASTAAHAGAAAQADHASPAAEPLCGRGPLNILLTNDDGFRAPGIQALYRALRGAGHRVVLSAPAANASGSSTSVTWSEFSVVRDEQDPAVFGITASPATAVAFGAAGMIQSGIRPDLVISGINDGSNVGGLLVASGTVGAALAGTMLLDRPVPGIAVNADRATREEPVDGAANRAHLDEVAVYVVRLVASMRPWACDGDRVARASAVLNVNYPGLAAAKVRGTAVVHPATASGIRIDFVPAADGKFQARPARTVTSTPEAGSDTAMLAAGYVTISVLSADLGSGPDAETALKAPLKDLRP